MQLPTFRNKRDTPLSQHIWEVHGGDPKPLGLCVMEIMCLSPRKGYLDKGSVERPSIDLRAIHSN